MRRLSPAMVLLLVSCGEPDFDGDGTPDSLDCAPEDATIHPGAVEVCDGVDQDCNGSADEGAVDATAWYLDDDGDGFGQDGSLVEACQAPPRHVAKAGDCDDDNAAQFPGAPEVCGDGVINDCLASTADCAIEGLIRLSEATVFTNVQADRCRQFGVDIDGDGVQDVGCSRATAVWGPLDKDLALRPQNLISRDLLGGGTLADADLDGQVDLLIAVPDEPVVDVYPGPWTAEIDQRAERSLSYTVGWRPNITVLPDTSASILLLSPDRKDMVWNRAPFDFASDLVVGASWRMYGSGVGRPIPDVDGDGGPDMLVRPDALDGRFTLVPGRDGLWTLEDALWSAPDGVQLVVGEQYVVGDVPYFNGGYRLVLLDPATGIETAELFDMPPEVEPGDDPCPSYPILADVNGDGLEDLFVSDHCGGSMLLGWFGPIPAPLPLQDPDLQLVADTVEGDNTSVAGVFKPVDLDEDGVLDLVVGVSGTVDGKNAEFVVFWGNRP